MMDFGQPQFGLTIAKIWSDPEIEREFQTDCAKTSKRLAARSQCDTGNPYL
jgi:hypothetical protein